MCDKKCQKYNALINKCEGIELVFALKYISLEFEQTVNLVIIEVWFLLITINYCFNMTNKITWQILKYQVHNFFYQNLFRYVDNPFTNFLFSFFTCISRYFRCTYPIKYQYQNHKRICIIRINEVMMYVKFGILLYNFMFRISGLIVYSFRKPEYYQNEEKDINSIFFFIVISIMDFRLFIYFFLGGTKHRKKYKKKKTNWKRIKCHWKAFFFYAKDRSLRNILIYYKKIK